MALPLATVLDTIGAVDTADLLVTINGIPLTDEVAASVLDVSVVRTLGAAAQLTLRVAAWDSDAEELRWVDDKRFAPGATIAVAMGYLGSRAPVFFGDIVGLSLEASTTARAVLTITAYDVLHRLGRAQRPSTYKDKTYTEIVREVAQRYSLAAEVLIDANVDPKQPSVTQEQPSDLAFLLACAEKINHELFARGPTLVFREAHYRGSPELMFDASLDLTQFSAHIAPREQIGGVDVKILNSETKETILVSVDNPDSKDAAFKTASSRTTLSAEPFTTEAQAKALAEAEIAKRRLDYLEATGTALGRTDLEPGMRIRIDNLGRQFGGAYYVTSVTHSISDAGGFRTSFTLKGEPR